MKRIVYVLISLLFLSISCARINKKTSNHTDDKDSKRLTSIIDLPVRIELNTVIELDTGIYCMNDLDSNTVTEYIEWGEPIEGQIYDWDKKSMIIKNLENIVIRGVGETPEQTMIYSKDHDAVVMSFVNCKNVTISNLWFGHITKSESCLGGVLYFQDCENITIDNLELYGTGFYGFEVHNGKTLRCTNTEIWDCSNSAFGIYTCDSVHIENGNFHHNESWGPFGNFYSVNYGLVKNSVWTKNQVTRTDIQPYLVGISYSKVDFMDCDLKENKVRSTFYEGEDFNYQLLGTTDTTRNNLNIEVPYSPRGNYYYKIHEQSIEDHEED